MTLSYRISPIRDPGLTSEMDMLATFLLGALAVDSAELAGGLGVTTALLLRSKGRLHNLAMHVLSAQDVQDLLYLGAAAFIVLPLLPDRIVDPWGTINPRQLWMLAVAMMSVSAFGYFTLRSLGSRKGLALAGLAGGFISSTAAIVAMAERARSTAGVVPSAACAALLSNLETVALMSVIIGTFSLPLLARLGLPLIAAGLGVIVAAAAFNYWAGPSPQPANSPASQERVFDPLRAVYFVGLIAVIMLLAGWMNIFLGAEHSIWILGASGVADVHAAAAAASRVAASSRVSLLQAEQGVVAAFCGNSLLKCILAWTKGGSSFALRVVPALVLMMAAFSLTSLCM